MDLRTGRQAIIIPLMAFNTVYDEKREHFTRVFKHADHDSTSTSDAKVFCRERKQIFRIEAYIYAVLTHSRRIHVECPRAYHMTAKIDAA